jgi:two-component system OmpR family response regulator
VAALTRAYPLFLGQFFIEETACLDYTLPNPKGLATHGWTFWERTALNDPSPVPSAQRLPGVLVVDDEAMIRNLLEAGLRGYGFRVQAVARGEEAVRFCAQHSGMVQLALLDVQMPGLDGPQTLQALLALMPSLPCFFMSGHLGNYTEEELWQLGARGIIRKPFALAEVAATLRQALPSPERRGSVRLADRQFRVALREGSEGWVKDRSQGGLGLWSVHPLAVDAVVDVRHADAPDTAPWVPVEVRHCRRADDGWALGCRFVDPSLAHTHLLAG